MKIKLVKSPIGKIKTHKKTIKALGFTKLGQVIEHEDNPQIRGMIKQVAYMLEIEE
ncbi:50S ribosomal protein L30 [Peptoniphilus catoniae]|uniref:50S ribosomal protein L30 n=1 Tax=Peptoniphilus catoniae TaxID=1660341 RepID=UPI0010FE2E0C|nr:50S ribosomal protein L30 [Peptoniphilus catoniae]